MTPQARAKALSIYLQGYGSTGPDGHERTWDDVRDDLATTIRAAIAEEREACANLAHNYGFEAHVIDHGDCVACSIPTKIAAAIRART